MALEQDRKALEDRLLTTLIRLSRIQFGGLSLSVCQDRLYQVVPHYSCKPGETPHALFDRSAYALNDHVRRAVAALCSLWRLEYGEIVLKINDGRLVHLDIHHAFSDPIEAYILRLRRESPPEGKTVA